MLQLRAATLVVMLVLFGSSAVSGAKCPRGWDPIGCNTSWKCVKPMSEFETEKACMRKGGVPSATVCLSRGKNKVAEKIGRYCIRDMKRGNMKFARTLKLAIAQQQQKENE